MRIQVRMVFSLPVSLYSDWTDHYREGDFRDESTTITMAVGCCNPHLRPCLAWLKIYNTVAEGEVPGSFTSLLVASNFGLREVVEELLKKDLHMWT